MDSPRGRIYLMKRGPRGRADDRLDGAALGRLPGLHGLRDRLPVRRAVRQADRGHPRAGRAAPPPRRQGPGAARADLRAVPAPAAAAAAARTAARATSAPGSTARCAGPACWSGSRRSWPRWRASRRGSTEAERLPERVAGARARAARSSGCSPAACRARSSPASTPPPRGCSRPRAATWSSPPAQGCCGALSVHNGREEEAQRYARALIDAFEAAGVEYVVVNAAGCGSTMKEYADLLRRRPGVRRPGAGLRRARSATSPSSSPSSARSPRGTRSR